MTQPNFLENYETVKSRKKRFYADHKDGSIIVEAVRIDEKTAIFKSYIYRTKEEQEKNLPHSTGYAQEFRDQGYVNKTSWCENCEESAVGRALDNAGYAGNDKCSREELVKAKNYDDGPAALTQQEKPSPLVTEKQLKYLFVKTKEAQISPDTISEYIRTTFNKSKSMELTQTEFQKLLEHIKSISDEGLPG